MARRPWPGPLSRTIVPVCAVPSAAAVSTPSLCSRTSLLLRESGTLLRESGTLLRESGTIVEGKRDTSVRESGTRPLNWAAPPTSERSSTGRGILISAHPSRATRSGKRDKAESGDGNRDGGRKQG